MPKANFNLLIGFESGLLPLGRAQTTEDIEEERRLAYVACTRARERLYLSWVQRRRIHGSDRFGSPSSFLADLDVSALRCVPDIVPKKRRTIQEQGHRFDIAAPPKKKPTTQQSKSKYGSFEPGDLVTHPNFGVGEILEVDHQGAKTKAKVDFPLAGTKTILTKFLQPF